MGILRFMAIALAAMCCAAAAAPKQAEPIDGWLSPEIVAGVAVREPVRIPIRYCMEGSKWCERMSADEDANRKLPAGLNMADSSAVALKTEIASIVI